MKPVTAHFPSYRADIDEGDGRLAEYRGRLFGSLEQREGRYVLGSVLSLGESEARCLAVVEPRKIRNYLLPFMKAYESGDHRRAAALAKPLVEKLRALSGRVPAAAKAEPATQTGVPHF